MPIEQCDCCMYLLLIKYFTVHCRACPNAERKKVFEKIRPLCVQLTKEHTRGNVQAVNTALSNIDKTVLQDLQEYLLFPFRLILKQEKK